MHPAHRAGVLWVPLVAELQAAAIAGKQALTHRFLVVAQGAEKANLIEVYVCHGVASGLKGVRVSW